MYILKNSNATILQNKYLYNFSRQLSTVYINNKDFAAQCDICQIHGFKGDNLISLALIISKVQMAVA